MTTDKLNINCNLCYFRHACKFKDSVKELQDKIEMDPEMKMVIEIRCSYYKGKPLPQYE